MAPISSLTRPGMRRLIALSPESRRGHLRKTMIKPEIAGALPDLDQRFADYLLDVAGRPMAVADDTSLLLRLVAPGSSVPISDEIAAVVAAPRLIEDGRLSARALSRRFAPRADDALAAAVASIAPDAAIAAIIQLATQHGPEEDRLHLALLQAGAAVAWRPELLVADEIGEIVVDALLALLDRRSPRPLLDAVAPILGAIAASPAAVGQHARKAVLACLVEMRRRVVDKRTGASFLDEFRALDRARAVPDEDYYSTLADRQVAEVAAKILGRSAEDLDAEGFAALQTEVVAGDFGSTLLPSFVDGLIGAVALAPLTELAGYLMSDADEEPRLLGLHIAAQLPLDACADACVAALDDGRARVRIGAVRAVTMLEPELAVPALTSRLDDPEPAVCAFAARALVDLGQREIVDARRMPGELAIGKTRERTAAARAALGEASLEVAGTLLPLAAADAEMMGGESPSLVDALTWMLRGSADGLRLAAAFIEQIPDALPVIALALAGDDEVPSVAVSPELRAELARVLDPIIAAGGEVGMMALELLARFSLGDHDMVEQIVDASVTTPGHAQQILSALACVRLRRHLAAAVLSPYLESRDHFAATVLAAGVAGVVLPLGHKLWAQVRDLETFGTIAAAASYTAIASGVRLRTED